VGGVGGVQSHFCVKPNFLEIVLGLFGVVLWLGFWQHCIKEVI